MSERDCQCHGTMPTGAALLHDPLLNKGTAFSEEERKAFGLKGLLPPQVVSIEDQVGRVLGNYRSKQTDLERYIHLASLQDRNETLFYRILMENLDEMMPIVYTPTVGQACQKFGHIFRRPRGLYLSIKDKGDIAEILKNYQSDDVRVIVVTDGERILGLGDQGTGGMGIPVGKLALYTACAGISPAQCLPVMIDVGTENEGYLGDPLYLGLRQHRVRGQEYDDFIAEFLNAATERWPNVLVQFEDFANQNAFRLLEDWRDKICTFNDDMQGTASVTLAGLLSALRITKKSLREQKVLFLGAGEAGIGIGDLIVSAMVDDGDTLEEARKKCWFVDSKGLIVKERDNLVEHKLRYAHDFPYQKTLLDAIKALKPTAIIGVSTIPKTFNQEVIDAMSEINEHPIIFALSNPTSKSECSAAEAYDWSKGKAVFASGSPFPPHVLDGKTFVPGQGNNAYVFPGIGLGVVATGAKHVTDRMFSQAARALAEQVLESDLEMGRIYPALTRIREVSAHIGVAVAEEVFKENLATIDRPADMLEHIKASQWQPEYVSYLK